jgi:hypothetical protein
MNTSATKQKTRPQTVTVEEVNRLLDLGRLLFSVLTPEEVETLQAEFAKCSISEEIGNTGDS